MSNDYPMTFEEFKNVYSKVPRLTVELIIKSEQGILLSLRDIEPYKGFWHLPGGTVLFRESLEDAVRRVAKKELNVEVAGQPEFLGYIEYEKYREVWFDQPVGMAFSIQYAGQLMPDEEATELEWFTELPDKILPDQISFIKDRIL